MRSLCLHMLTQNRLSALFSMPRSLREPLPVIRLLGFDPQRLELGPLLVWQRIHAAAHQRDCCCSCWPPGRLSASNRSCR
jgi:hypothetical protein